ncbi:hypothetical protein L2E82_49756 [Cichorium intybus]|uniref:Uncharacterized protein n=1 Tax=Cichorium intybus TaxID=13427 RepID=A0ACB8Z0S6_CICIN|nr:hypothetical protein L2E82_49756 [Cichorium intybus]
MQESRSWNPGINHGIRVWAEIMESECGQVNGGVNCRLMVAAIGCCLWRFVAGDRRWPYGGDLWRWLLGGPGAGGGLP